MNKNYCLICGKKVPEELYHSFRYCSDACREVAATNKRIANNERCRLKRRKWVEEGKCYGCGCENDRPGRTKCSYCAFKEKIKQKERREKQKND